MDKNSSKEEVIKVLRRDGNLIRFANPDFKKDFDVVMTAVKNNGTSLYYADKTLKDNDDIVINAVKKNGLALKYASERLKNIEHIVELAVKNNGDSLEYASELLRGNENIVKLAVNEYGQAIRYANDSLRKNKEIITIAVKNRGSSLSYLDKSFQDDEEIVMKAIKNNGTAIEFASSRLRNSRPFALAAVEQSGYAYQYIGITQKKDRQITLQAIKNGFPYEELDTEFKNDYEISLEAAKSGISYEDLGQKLKNNKEFLIESVSVGEYIYEELPEKWKNNKDIILAVLKNTPEIYKDLTQKNKSDYDITLAAVTYDGDMLEYIPIEMKSNEDIVFAALTQGKYSYEMIDSLSFTSDSIKHNVEFIVKLLRTLENKYGIESRLNELKEINDEIFCDKKFIIGLIDLDEYIIDSACDKLKNDDNFINELLTKSYYAFKYASEKIRNDKNLVITILDTHPYLMEYMGDKLKEDEELAFIAVTKYELALNFFNRELNHNRELIIHSLRSFPKRSDIDFEYYKEDKEIMLYYVKNHQNSLVNVSDILKNDLEIVSSAIENDPNSIQYASLDIQNNREIVLKAVSTDGNILRHILPIYLSDKEIVSAAVSNAGWGSTFEYASDNLKKDKEVVSKALKNNIFSVDYVDKSVLEDVAFLTEEILNNFNLLSVLPKQYFTASLKKKLIMEIIKNKRRLGDYHPFNDFYYLPSFNSNSIISLEKTRNKSFFPQYVVLKFEDGVVGRQTKDYSEFKIMMDSYDDDKGFAKFCIDGFSSSEYLYFGAYPISYSTVDIFADNLKIIDIKQHNQDLYILIENDNIRFSFYNKKIAEIISEINESQNKVETNNNSEKATKKPSKEIEEEYIKKDAIEVAKDFNTDSLKEILQSEPKSEDVCFNHSSQVNKNFKPKHYVSFERGDTITFGTYKQENNIVNGKEAIEWIVLDKKDDNFLVISKYVLDQQQYNSINKSITWEKSTIRSWLNSTFINDAFSTEERERIHYVTVINNVNPKYGTYGGKNTEDRVFLLSIDEASSYFSADLIIPGKATPYAISKGAWVNDEGYSSWWLRSRGKLSNYVAYVYANDISAYGHNCNYTHFSVRPALWIDFSTHE